MTPRRNSGKTPTRSTPLSRAIHIALTSSLLARGAAPAAFAEDSVPAPAADDPDATPAEVLENSEAPVQIAQASGSASDQDEDVVELEEVVVTGSQIRGAGISEALAVSVIDAEAIGEFASNPATSFSTPFRNRAKTSSTRRRTFPAA